jgi:hypothetical protein
MPLTMPSLEPRTIFLRALTEPQATKLSRRWQPPGVTSTTGLQYEHLVPLDAISQSNALGIALTRNRIALLQARVRGSPSTPQAWTLSLKGAKLVPRLATHSFYSPKG